MEKQSTRFAELLGKVMQTEDGREFFFELLGLVTFTMGCGSESFMGYEIGRRSIGDELLHVLREDVDEGLVLELKMRQEARARPKEKVVDPYAMFEGGDE